MHLAAQAKGCGAIAASAFGAGFGGSVWALVRDADVPSFIEKWSADYAKAFPGPAGAPSPYPPATVSRPQTRPVLSLTNECLGLGGAETAVFFPMVPGPGAFEVSTNPASSL